MIKLALQSPETDKRTEALRFMVETGLIADSDIKKGVEGYLAEKKPVPGLATPIAANQLGVIPGSTDLRSESGGWRFIGFRAEMEGDQPAIWALLSSAQRSHPELGVVAFTFPQEIKPLLKDLNNPARNRTP